jgi:hypothetical protein
MSENITIDITEPADQNILVNIADTVDNYVVSTFPGGAVWGNIIGSLSAQTDLYQFLTGEDIQLNDLSGSFINFETFVQGISSTWVYAYDASTYFSQTSASYALYSYLVSNFLFLTGGTIYGDFNVTGNVGVSGNLNVQNNLLSANTPLHDIFLTSETDSQTLSFNTTTESLSVSNGNAVSLVTLGYKNIVDTVVDTIQQFAFSYAEEIYPGYNVTLKNGRVYTFAGTDKNNPNHYLEVNVNPYRPIYREIPLNTNQAIIDSYYIGDFKTAKYNLQVENNYNNDIYYSEVNTVGSVQTSTGVAVEYGQIYTEQLIIGYSVELVSSYLQLIINFSNENDPNKKLIVKGHRTNFYKI